MEEKTLGRVAVYTLGCKVNQYESQALAELLAEKGVLPVERGADACIVNTCAVTAESERKARQTVRRAIRENPGAYILVTGCAAQDEASPFENIPGVDFISGNRDKKALAAHILAYLRTGDKITGTNVADLSLCPYEQMTVSSSERTRAYMKVEDGCDGKCAYCIIPRVRGGVCSRPLADCIDEAERLAAAGYKEIVLTGIEISAYGKDLPGTELPDLIRALEQVEGLERVRLSSVDPSMLRPEWIDKVKNCAKLAPHMHLSLQSGCDETLRRMRRKYNTSQVLRNIGYMQKVWENLHFTADIIVGFPGETEEEFEETCRFVLNLPLLHAHIFTYSPRPQTEAASMSGQVPESVKAARSARLTEICNSVRDAELAKAEGRVCNVLFESRSTGHTDDFIEVSVREKGLQGQIRKVLLGEAENGIVSGKLLPEGKDRI